MAQRPQTVAECHAVIALLMERVDVLEERVNPGSNNLSKPPLSNGPGQMNRINRRRPSSDGDVNSAQRLR